MSLPTRVAPARVGIAARLLWLGLLSAVLVSLAAGYLLRAGVADAVWTAFGLGLEERGERVLARVGVSANARLSHVESARQDEFSRIFSGWYWELESAGETLRSRSLWDGRIDVQGVGPGELLRAVGPNGEALIGLRREAMVAGHTVALSLYGPATQAEAALRRFDHGLLVTAVVLVLVLMVATWLQVRLGLRPLDRLKAATAAAATGHREQVGKGYGPDLDPLAAELDALFVRNARIVARARGHAADLAHALKKPLAVLLGACPDSAVNPQAELVRSQVVTMTGLIERHLARAGSGAGERRRWIVAERVLPLLTLMRRLHGERGLRWEADISPGLDWRGEVTDLEEMLGNLLDNAGKWAKGQVMLTARRDGSQLIVCIEDDGPGLSASQLAQIAQRGRRFDESVEGSGLGLAIVADIADTYDGQVQYGRSELGGLRVQLDLPG